MGTTLPRIPASPAVGCRRVVEPDGDVRGAAVRADRAVMGAGSAVVVFVAGDVVASQRREHRPHRNGFGHRDPEGGDHATDSSCSSALFASTPPTYCPMLPSLRTTRWHGTTTGSGFFAHAVPTARTARGLPAAAAISA